MMNKIKNGFTIAELTVTLFIITIILVIIIAVIPSFIDNFINQKDKLYFQQSFILDNFYLNKKITNSSDVIELYSSGVYDKNNSYLTLQNDKGDYSYSLIYLGDDNGKPINQLGQRGKIIVKNTFFYSDFAKVGEDIYYTNPGQHTIYKYNINLKTSTLVYGEIGKSGLSNSGIGLFNTPTGITYDGTNILYISDSGNNIIRSINISNGEISVIAGNEEKSGYNDTETQLIGTQLSQSLLDYPTGITYFDNFLYLSDSFNNRIRKIDINNQKIYTLIGSDYRGFNFDNGLGENVYINGPLSIAKVDGGIVFGDVLNGKIRYYNENNNQITTVLGIEKLNQKTYSTYTKYTKNFYNSYILSYGNGFYFNDSKNGVIYDYSFGVDGIMGNADDKISNLIGSLDNNMLINGDIENEVTQTGVTNDLVVSDTELFYKTNYEKSYPISGDSYLAVNTIGKYASGTINFYSNPDDGETIQIGDKIFEYDDGLLSYTLSNIVIPIGDNIEDTINNTLEIFGNYNINQYSSGSFIKLYSSIIGEVGNNIVFSGSSYNYSLDNYNNKLYGGIEYTSGYKNFSFINDFQEGEIYELSFYVLSDEIEFGDVIEPIITINTGTGNIEEKIVNVSDKWVKKSFIFNGLGKDQIINFNIKNSHKIYFDNIKIQPIGNSQSYNLIDKSKFKIGILNSFYVLDSDNIIIDNTLNKKLILYGDGSLSDINDDYYLYDLQSCKLNLKNDYMGSSNIEVFNYQNKNHNIIYEIGIDGYIMNISNNIN